MAVLEVLLENMEMRIPSPNMSKTKDWSIMNCMKITNCRSFNTLVAFGGVVY